MVKKIGNTQASKVKLCLDVQFLYGELGYVIYTKEKNVFKGISTVMLLILLH